jgi:predicted acyltransferase
MDTVLGLLELALYIVAVLGLSMLLTWVVIKISPSESAKEQKAQARAEGNS